jgi:hypothetical protein
MRKQYIPEKVMKINVAKPDQKNTSYIIRNCNTIEEK